MKKVNHIVFDIENNNFFLKKYWNLSYIFNKTLTFLKDVNINIKIKNNSRIFTYKIFKNQNFFTIKLNTTTLFNKIDFKKEQLDHIMSRSDYLMLKKINIKNNSDFLKNEFKKNFYINSLTNIYNIDTYTNKIATLYKFFINKKSNTFISQNLLYSLININFLRKERLYTKLKYSRTPAFDIVSGGFAILLAGFLGFLTSEKFGLELGDSGDFYFVFMYLGILIFMLRPLLVIADVNKGYLYLFSLVRVIKFYKILLTLLLNFLFLKN